MKKHSWLLVILLTLGFASGCGKGTGSGPVNAKAFDNAIPEAKVMWEKALTAAGTNDYVPAVLMCRTLAAREDLTPDQKTTVENKLSDIYDKMNSKAGNGDKQAQAAIDELRKIGRPRN
jgi:hypothetical protein